jgi:hypothetical protein
MPITQTGAAAGLRALYIPFGSFYPTRSVAGTMTVATMGSDLWRASGSRKHEAGKTNADRALV